jgi:hypothetical protein
MEVPLESYHDGGTQTVKCELRQTKVTANFYREQTGGETILSP